MVPSDLTATTLALIPGGMERTKLRRNEKERDENKCVDQRSRKEKQNVREKYEYVSRENVGQDGHTLHSQGYKLRSLLYWTEGADIR